MGRVWGESLQFTPSAASPQGRLRKRSPHCTAFFRCKNAFPNWLPPRPGFRPRPWHAVCILFGATTGIQEVPSLIDSIRHQPPSIDQQANRRSPKGILEMSTTFIIARRQEPQAALQRLFAAAGISLAVLFGLSATAEAGIIVSLQQVDANGSPVSSVDANPDPAQQTLTYANLVVTGSGAPLPVGDLFSFATALTWATSSPGAAVTSLYTVNASGAVTIGSTAMSVNELGFLFNGGEGAFASSVMNTSSLDADSERYVFVDNESFAPTLTNPVGGVTIARIRFAIAPGVTNATFDFTLDGSAVQGYGFLDNEIATYSFTNGGGTIAVVPEPGTIPAGLLGLVVIGGWMKRRSRRQRDSSAPMASAA
jgi:hypothetical protein